MATIYCFSATGNSLHAAREIAKAIGGTVKPITRNPAMTGDDMVGLVFPCFFWSAPNIVLEFAKNLKITNKGAYVFTVMTSGGSGFGAVNAVRGRLKPAYAAELKTADNYVPMYEPTHSDATYEKEQAQLQQIISDIKARKKQRGGLYTPVNRVVRLFLPTNDCDSKFVVTGCTGCGLCAGVCPVKNILMEAGSPKFTHRCEHCLACLHACPAKAIDYGKSAGKERYIHPGIHLAQLLESRKEQ